MKKPGKLYLIFAILFFVWGISVASFSVLKVRGLPGEKWNKPDARKPIYGELDYLRDNPGYLSYLVGEKLEFFAARDLESKALINWKAAQKRVEIAKKLEESGNDYLELSYYYKSSIYAREAVSNWEKLISTNEKYDLAVIEAPAAQLRAWVTDIKTLKFSDQGEIERIDSVIDTWMLSAQILERLKK